MTIILGLFVGHWLVSAFFQSSFHHRYASHRMFTLSPRAERVWHVLAFVAQGSSYLSPRAYAIMHREHHAYSDTARDPHAPRRFANVFTMMWATAKHYNGFFFEKVATERRFLGGYPVWPTLERLGSAWPVRIAWGAAYTVVYLVFASQWWLYLLLPIQWSMGPVHGAIVNWCGHRYGYRNHDTNDASRNFLPVDFLTLGELYQNNHHRAASRLDFACRWFEFDPTHAVLRLLAWMGLLELRAGEAA
jgi:stearoyl-CoA desaturase (delta-9 desaturase)